MWCRVLVGEIQVDSSAVYYTIVSGGCRDVLIRNLRVWQYRRCADTGFARTYMAATKNALRHLGPCRPRVPCKEERRQWIREVAYYKAMSRRFSPGHELVDWLAAEREVDGLCRPLSES